MDQLLSITWDAGRGIDLGFFTLRYYSLLFALGFVLGYFIMKRIFKREGIPVEKLDTLLTYVVVATIVGARLGHVFFYQWDYYSQHPGDIIKVWEGGLASHGAAVAIIIAMIIYSRKVLDKPTLWILDRVVITVALAGCFIRLGNFANSEIYGDVSNSAWEMVFTNPVRERIINTTGDAISELEFIEKEEYETDSLTYPIYDLEVHFNPNFPNREAAQSYFLKHVKPLLASTKKEDKNLLITGNEFEWDESETLVGTIEARGYPRRPTQIFEALAYLAIFFILARLYLVADVRQRIGMLFGLFLILVFGFRFAIEFLKENQVSAEEGRAFNIGQSLSIPLVIAGLYFSIFAKKLKNEKE
ncbi:prolipoprotein diacylglyceryl transferase [Croceimicrobium sp.]|uniref:prolipoprotein diacylglyceryl transferase n=1 Tax=Croceimicrobium sp. TaxID=2828340 RepID=UPI003BAC62C3